MQAGAWLPAKQLWWRGLGGPGGQQDEPEPAVRPGSRDGQHLLANICSVLLTEEWPVYEGKGLLPSVQHSLDHIYDMASSTVLPSPSKRQTLINWNDFCRGHHDGQGWSTCPVRASWGSWACSAWRRHGSRRNLTLVSVHMGSLMRRIFTVVYVRKMREQIGSWNGRFGVDIRRNFITIRIPSSRTGGPVRGCAASFLGGFQTRLGKALSNLIWPHSWPWFQQEAWQETFWSPFTLELPCDPMTMTVTIYTLCKCFVLAKTLEVGSLIACNIHVLYSIPEWIFTISD